MVEQTADRLAGRVTAVDVLRGLTVALMLLVNDPGDWHHIYAQLDHSEWNGCTLTDLVFPTFLFVMGCSIIFSMQARLAKGDTGAQLAKHIARRSGGLLLLGWFLAALPHFQIMHMRLYGVLPRIALCAFFAGLICLMVRRWQMLALLTVAILVSYWVLMRFVPVPGYGMPVHDVPLLDPDGNLAAWLDRALHLGRLYEHTRDPEGLLSTLPAVATTLLGALTGYWLRSATPERRKTLGMLGAAAALLAAGWLWGYSFPINKKLWTSSYVLLSAGWALLALTLLYWLLDVVRLQERALAVRAAIWPWLVFGSNAIAAFAIQVLLVKLCANVHVAHDNTPTTLWTWLYEVGFARHGSTLNTSLAFAVVFVGVCFVPVWVLWRKRIFLKF
jgi:predicted acyltransferase